MIKLIAIGKNKDKALQSLEKEYMKRLSAFCKFSEIEVKDEYFAQFFSLFHPTRLV